jgi:hypothetical protein
MRTTVGLMLAGSALLLLTAPATAAPCPFPMVRVCAEPPPNRPQTTPMQCRCENAGGKTPYAGKAQIHKKNIPTVKPNKTPGPNG